MIDEYKPNSNKFKEEKKENAQPREKLEPVVTGKVIQKKKSGVRKFFDEFVSEDAKNIKSYVIGDVLIPATKKAISDIVTDGIDILLYGNTGSKRSRSNYQSGRVSYNSLYDNDRRYNSPSRYNDPVRDRYSYNEIILGSRGEAEEVLSRMDELMETYGLVRVADLYDLVGVTGEFTDNKYGWTNIRNAEIVRVRDGYAIKMPRAIPID